jgi:hypothetical protein
MTPSTYALDLYRGDTYHWSFVLWDDTDKTVPHDLTGVVVKAEIRDRPGGSVVSPLALTVILPNTIDAAMDAAQSAQLPDAGVWDLQLTYPDNFVATVLAGDVTVTPDVTDSVAAAPMRRRA